ncbi:MAG: Nif3-like dinuclear metal center hexameric protein, partial [Acidimicrobiia bacterium]
MHVADLVYRLDARFPFVCAAAWDVVGLQIGWPRAELGRVGVCHEVTDAVVDACIQQAITTIVSYHPLLFSPTTDLVDGPTPEGRALRLARNGISLIVVHTAFDTATPGTGDALLDALGLISGDAHRWAIEDGPGECAPGRFVELATPMSGGDLASLAAATLDTSVRSTGADGEIRTVAVLPGSGGSHAIEAATIADALITGDVSHHTATAAKAHGLLIIDAGHAATERPGIAALY